MIFLAAPFAIFALLAAYALSTNPCTGPRAAEYQCEEKNRGGQASPSRHADDPTLPYSVRGGGARE